MRCIYGMSLRVLFYIQKRELHIWKLDLKHLQSNFKDFWEYRDREKKCIETFGIYFNRHEVMKQVAKEVLTKLASRIEKGDSEKLCKFLACVVAPRCSFPPVSTENLAKFVAKLNASSTPVSTEGDTKQASTTECSMDLED